MIKFEIHIILSAMSSEKCYKSKFLVPVFIRLEPGMPAGLSITEIN